MRIVFEGELFRGALNFLSENKTYKLSELEKHLEGRNSSFNSFLSLFVCFGKPV